MERDDRFKITKQINFIIKNNINSIFNWKKTKLKIILKKVEKIKRENWLDKKEKRGKMKEIKIKCFK